ncbi:hypothetical protein [Tunicatimonas pelagia]|uniref:hypothetical protein n=1 Tax=Tunicatimonas pelagia TaxID=931531 RepID=UPI0026656F29|nr:hypothetical protein [Tunicatimonas pelagia]WKN42348.1 hypothetical protein P0M28_25260 [Tunicatimonas pelagia]
MWEVTVNSDPISDEYRKYVIGICYESTQRYILWATDMSDQNELDKLWLDQQQKILLFDTISQVPQAIISNQYPLFDEKNFLAWANEYSSFCAYTHYNLDKIKLLVCNHVDLDSLSHSEAMTIVDFINLFGDYASQQEEDSPDLLSLHQQKSIRTFYDFAYDNYVWDSPEHSGYRSLNELDYLRFDQQAFRNAIRQMIEQFMVNTVQYHTIK